MLDPTPDLRRMHLPDVALSPARQHLLHALTRAYARGDAPLGEYLLGQALDEGLPWDEVCAAAASGSARSRREAGRG